MSRPHAPQSFPAPGGVSPGRDAAGEAPGRRAYRGDVDLLRLAACLTVMLGHAGGTLIRRTQDEHQDSAAYLVGHLAEAVNPWAVPMFFAIAGWAVLAGAPPRDQATMLGRIVRHAVPLAFWSLAYLGVYKMVAWDEVDVRGTLVQLPFSATGPGYHLWYLYLYIPLITLFGAAVLLLRGKRPWGLALLGLLFSGGAVLFELVQHATGLDLGGWRWGVTTYAVVYFTAGGLLIHSVGSLRLPRWACWAAGIVFAGASALVFLWETRVHYPIENANPLTPVLGVCVILLIAAVWRGARGSGPVTGGDGLGGRRGLGGRNGLGGRGGLGGAQTPVDAQSPTDGRSLTGERAAAVTAARRSPLLSRLACASFGAFLVHVFLIDAWFGTLFPLDWGLLATTALFLCGWLGCFAVSLTASLLWGRLPHARRLLG
ncbi:acyltransferase [Brevibacterium salitolerans]|uniref:Acyltransferase 3 domain-containing protein n=1 Tax=Brevibacterium salitolerans TaxID=1403566 RepID=A0ABN2X544_9MICO